ncbi:SCO family protein [Ideonella sp. BN130291]|uniref:SCO family protein n=1 Tax=Ideonella sp. BN130291 TaxID=3112940 RepID=UPI002E25D2B3|nr:SCO family protein [Ideonella sp. BN130291]
MNAARRALVAAAALAATLWATEGHAAAPGATPPLKAGVFEPPRLAPPVLLEGSDGRAFDLSRHRGKVVLLSFGFSSCPAVCPTTLATLAQARKALGADAKDVQVVFVTVDPERDTVQRLKDYMAAFDPGFIGATGRPEALARVRASFGATATKVTSGAAYGFDHTSSVYLIDRAGRLVGMMPYDHPAKDYVHDLRLLLAAR